MHEKNMSIYDHLGELRKRLTYIVVFFVLFVGLGLLLAKPVILYLQHDPVANGIQMNAFNLTDPLKVYINFSFIIGLLLTLPFALYQLWAFIAPGLYENERKVTLSYIPITFFLFALGLAFGYYILFPLVVHFMGNIAESLDINGVYGINEYFSFLFNLVLPFGLVFQFPVLIMFLTRLGLLTPMLLRRIRKFAYFGILVIAGMIAPPELISHLTVTIPLILLYEISIVIAARSFKKRMRAEQEAEYDLQLKKASSHE
ncbi:Sec-independent protein translocase protein tatCy [Fictibacillus macauensis ZFHKF-1]|uniref:Sec-independent protein translocase protein TatC n=1 Tax=Fictibacillus macauensis ZFHKF-1 TaxID=1196324 RepID=I8AFJ5_9BACL|nr:twin-arginine translocase subunit TatC [Fictibacillus macauensis]EIT84407.1 Sec-independent protein translocase protein tatCy [Fictibacillus macauensis ZFHKF-1]